MRPARGFTLVEVLATVLVLGMVSMIVALLIPAGLSNYSQGVTQNRLAALAQVAETRLGMELRDLASVTGVTATALVFVNKSGVTKTISYNAGAGTVSINGNTLVGSVQAFFITPSYADMDGDGASEVHDLLVSMTLSGHGTAFTQRVYPRYQSY